MHHVLSSRSLLGLLLLAAAAPPAPAQDAPSHARPYFLPQAERDRIRRLIQAEPWARAEYDRVQKAAAQGDGFWAGFLFALDGDARHLPAARKFLLDRCGPNAYWTQSYRKRLDDPDYFKAGQPGIPEVYYDLDISAPVVFDWVHDGLKPDERREIEDGLLLAARFRMKAMDRWTQTPNLVFKPTFMVAMTGMATRNQECLDWGLRRTKPWGGRLGGYFEVFDVMLRDGGPWHEAPIYPIAHETLWCMAVMSRYRQLYDGRDWFAAKVASGGSPKGLADYYLDTAYPVERGPDGLPQVRVATYGDGATGPGGDLFLVRSAPGGLNMEKALAECYNTSGDPRYAAFLKLRGAYQPGLWERRPLPAEAPLPPAPSKVWPGYGLAMLRSDESPAYWTSGRAIAVLQVMSQGYGHDHRDKFGIMLHGAGRLFYPDYNAIQYENMTVGWTRNSVSHNTVLVDEQDTQDAPPTGIRHDFSPEVKFLATSASGVFEGVAQTRALLLTGEYLLDVFHLASSVPHTYDYLLHTFGRPAPQQPEAFEPSDALRRRYWLVEDQRARTTADAWAMDLLIEDQAGRGTLRLNMAGEPDTVVAYGAWGKELARLVAERSPKAKLDPMWMVAARRARLRSTAFIAAHEPCPSDRRPAVRSVARLAESPQAVAVRVDAGDFTDYAVVAFGPQKEIAEHVLAAGDALFAFKSYGYLRVGKTGAVARGGWTAFSVPGARGPLVLNGKPAAIHDAPDRLAFGPVDKVTLPKATAPEVECPLAVSTAPRVVRVYPRDRRAMKFIVKNPLAQAVSGRIELDLSPSPGVSLEPAAVEFGTLKPGETREVPVTLVAADVPPGKRTIPFRVTYRPEGAPQEVRCPALPLVVASGPTLEPVYQHPEPAVYRVHAPGYTAQFDMFHGLCRYLADPDDAVRLDGSPLFTFSDGQTEMLGPGTKHAFTWPKAAPADLVAHAYDKCRWQAVFLGDRILFRMDPGWTQFETTHFTVPGAWKCPGGAPRWRRIIAVDAQGKPYDARPDAKAKVSSAELDLPGARWNLAFRFEPPQEVTFEGAGMKFRLGSLTRDAWSVGFVAPGGRKP